MLYGAERVVRSYLREDAELKALLVSIDPSLNALGLVDSKWDPDRSSVAVVSDSLFLHVHAAGAQRKLLLKVPLRDIQHLEPLENSKAVALNLFPSSAAGPSPQLFRWHRC